MYISQSKYTNVDISRFHTVYIVKFELKKTRKIYKNCIMRVSLEK